jgi:hypothetical protein
MSQSHGQGIYGSTFQSLGDAWRLRMASVAEAGAWEAAIQQAFAREVAPSRDDPMLVGWFWMDTPTWDVLRTRALRGTEWVSAVRTLPTGVPGREA